MAKSSAQTYAAALKAAGKSGDVTTEIRGPPSNETGARYYFAEDYHQQYLSKPGARPYCSAQPTGVPVPREWLKENSAKFGEGYWKMFGPKPGCTINVPNEQISLEAAMAVE